MRKNKLTAGLCSMLLATVLLPTAAFAHVVVTPDQTGVGARTAFVVGVPNEKDVAVTGVKLLVPKGVENVQPNVTAGWKITVVHDGDNVSSITWKGTIPAGQRADFDFKAQAPARASELHWKAYQTYADGTVVRWDQNPTAADKDNAGPYSITKVVDDLDGRAAPPSAGNQNTLALAFSIAAVLLSVGGLFLRRRR